MSVSQAPVPRWRGFTLRFTRKMLSFFLPRNSKRSLFLTSLFVEIAKISPTHEQCLRALNERLKIASGVEALQLPAYMHTRLWRGKDIETCESVDDGEEIDRVCQRLITIAPPWMRYDNSEKMMTDLREVIRLGREYHRVA